MSSISVNGTSVAGYAAFADNTLTAVKADLIKEESNKAAIPAAEISKSELQRAVDVVNQAVAIEQRSLSFSIDNVSGRSVIKVIDFETDELIKQIPSEELLKVAQNIKRLQEEMGLSIGLLIDNKV
jgi:flagellar protein FlaG